MPTNTSMFNTYGRLELEASASLSAAGAVSATVGDEVTCEKTGTGQYKFTFRNPMAVVLNAVIGAVATVRDPAVGTVKDAGIVSVTQNAAGNIEVLARTVDAAGADVNEATSALNLDVRAVIRTRSMGAMA